MFMILQVPSFSVDSFLRHLFP